MEKPFFVMLNCQKGGFTPMMDESGDEIAAYHLITEARVAARGNPLGAHFGYEIFCIGDGEQ